MGNRSYRRIIPACLLAVLPLAAASCTSVEGRGPRARCEKQVSLTAPLEPGGFFSAATQDGSITIEGTDANECTVLATVVTHARTKERAEELAAKIDVKLERSLGSLKAVVKKPLIIENADYSVSLKVTVPTQTNVTLMTGDGALHVASITGDMSARTSDGRIQARDAAGEAKFETIDGDITCVRLSGPTLDCRTSDGRIRLSDIAVGSCKARASSGSVTLDDVRGDIINVQTDDGPIRCRSVAAAELGCEASDGSVHIEYAADAPKDLTLYAIAFDGDIMLTAPPGLSAAIKATSSDGSIHTSVPIRIQSGVGKSLTGTVGDGEGNVYLKTDDGSITIRTSPGESAG